MRKKNLGVLIAMGGILLLVAAASRADVIITLKSGKIMTVKAKKADVVSIAFDDDGFDRPTSSSSLTLDFETGNLDGWSATGTAFDHQPTYGDNPTARHRGQPSNHQGDYWIGGFENRPTPNDAPGAIQGDGPQGTLTSRPFIIKKPTISFLVGGGCDINTERVELIVDGTTVRQSTGKCTETMAREEWNVADFMGKKAMIRLVDSSSGGWGHINFDDVRFY